MSVSVANSAIIEFNSAMSDDLGAASDVSVTADACRGTAER